MPGLEVSVWFALFAPGWNTPKPVIDLLNNKLNAVLAVPEVREAFLKVGHDPVGGEPEVLAAQVRTDVQKWSRIVREKNIRVEN